LTGFSFGPTTASSGLGAATAAPALGGLGTSALGASLSTGAVSKASTPAAGLLGQTSSAPAVGLSLNPASTAKTTAALPTLGGSSLFSGASTSGAPAAVPAAVTTTTSLTSAAAPAQPTRSLTYKQLEDQIDKWYVELEDQQSSFLKQATEVNAWDKQLIENGQKITDLNADVEKVKLDQNRLNNELEFIITQQNELEEMLKPLEDSVAKYPPINYQQHTDTERENTYQMAESIDAQLKRMTDDLKEVIDHLNTGTGAGDKNKEPMLQISKILNAHMESLQWVDQNAALLHKKTEEIARYAEYTKKEHERNFRLAFS